MVKLPELHELPKLPDDYEWLIEGGEYFIVNKGEKNIDRAHAWIWPPNGNSSFVRAHVGSPEHNRARWKQEFPPEELETALAQCAMMVVLNVT
jgi:hypothetical protein